MNDVIETLRTSRSSAYAVLVGAASLTFLSVALLPGGAAAASLALGLPMLAIAAVDADRFIIPDALSLSSIPLGLLASGHLLDPAQAAIVSAEHVVAAIIAAVSLHALAAGYRALRGREGIGLGDVKLAAAAGAWVGPDLIASVLLLASLSALLWVLSRSHGRGLDKLAAVPFGAFLAPAIWVVWFSAIALPLVAESTLA